MSSLCLENSCALFYAFKGCELGITFVLSVPAAPVVVFCFRSIPKIALTYHRKVHRRTSVTVSKLYFFLIDERKSHVKSTHQWSSKKACVSSLPILFTLLTARIVQRPKLGDIKHFRRSIEAISMSVERHRDTLDSTCETPIIPNWIRSCFVHVRSVEPRSFDLYVSRETI